MSRSEYENLERRSRKIDATFLAMCGLMSVGSFAAGIWGAWAALGIASLREGAGKIWPSLGCAVMLGVAAIAAKLSANLWSKLRQLWR